MCIQLDNYDLSEKAQLKLSPLIQNGVQQDYLPESCARHLPSFQNVTKLLHPPGRVECSPFPWNFMGNLYIYIYLYTQQTYYVMEKYV